MVVAAAAVAVVEFVAVVAVVEVDVVVQVEVVVANEPNLVLPPSDCVGRLPNRLCVPWFLEPLQNWRVE